MSQAPSPQKQAPPQRLFQPGGSPNIIRLGLEQRLFDDLYHFLLRTSWPRMILIIIGIYVGTNVLFALLYLLGGFWAPEGKCLDNSDGSFKDAFFFSVQTMATIGYGKMTPKTFYADILVTFEALAGIIEVAMITGLMFAKFSQPRARILFSDVAVISQRDGVPSLMFRMGNKRTNQIVEAHIRVVLARNETTVEGEGIRRFYDLEISRSHNAFFALSWTVVHPITEKSLLYGQTEESLTAARAEVIISLTGIDETSSQTVHARHSYVPSELKWGYRLSDIMFALPDGRRAMDYNKFHDIEPWPLKSEKEAAE